MRRPGLLTRFSPAISGRPLAYLRVISLAWLPGVLYLQEMFHDPSVNPLARLTWAFGAGLVDTYLAGPLPAPGWLCPAALALALAGCVWALACGRGWALVFLVLWAGVPTVAVLSSKSIMTDAVSARHLFNLLGPLTLLCGAGAFGAPACLRAGQRLALALGALLCLGLMWPVTAHLPDFYARSISFDRDYFFWLATQARPGDGLHFEGYKRKSKAFGGRFSLPGVFAGPGDMEAPHYRRVVLSE